MLVRPGLFTLPSAALKLAEQNVVRWEEDAAVSECPFCK